MQIQTGLRFTPATPWIPSATCTPRNWSNRLEITASKTRLEKRQPRASEVAVQTGAQCRRPRSVVSEQYRLLRLGLRPKGHLEVGPQNHRSRYNRSSERKVETTIRESKFLMHFCVLQEIVYKNYSGYPVFFITIRFVVQFNFKIRN